RRSRDEDRGCDRRRPAAEAGTGLRHPGLVHARLVRAAPALVQHRAEAGHGRGLQHLRGKRADVMIPPRRAGRDGTQAMPGIDESRAFIPLKIAVLTVSDTRSLDEDKSGATLVERVGKAGHAVAARAIVTDDKEKI